MMGQDDVASNVCYTPCIDPVTNIQVYAMHTALHEHDPANATQNTAVVRSSFIHSTSNECKHTRGPT